MCVSVRPAKFSDTIVGTWEGSDGRRYLAYQNTALSLVSGNSGQSRGTPTETPSRPIRRGSTRSRLSLTAPRKPSNWTFEEAETPAAPPSGNAMILPIPDWLQNIKVVNTETCGNFLRDIRQALTPVSRGRSRRGGMLGSKGADAAVRVIESGIYHVVLSESAAAIAKALKTGAVPAEKVPTLSRDILDAYEEWYPEWSIAVCCFNNTEARRAKPLLFSFEPTRQDNPDDFFIPTLDGHDGKRPSLTSDEPLDHTIFVASSDMDTSAASQVRYSDSDIKPGVAACLPGFVMGTNVKGSYRNGDVIFRRADLARGVLRGLRALPPGAPDDRKRIYI